MTYNFLPSIELVSYRGTVKEHLKRLGLLEKEAEKKGKILIDTLKLSSFIEFVVNTRYKVNSASKSVLTPFRPCVKEDFTKNGIEESKLNSISYRICPDFKEGNENFKVKNSYQNETERQSFSVDLNKCLGPTCKNDTEIKDFLDVFYFNFYMAHDQVNFQQKKFDIPVKFTSDHFHS
jgi:hypothetical protein